MKMTSIEPSYSPDPHYRRNFTVTCHSHRINTIVTSAPSVVSSWINSTRNYHCHRINHGRLVVGLGVQWTPPSGSGDPIVASTLQLCVGHQCLIFQLLHADYVPDCLRDFLVDPDVNFVGVSNFQDKKTLIRSEHELSVGKLVDLRDVASDREGYSRKISLEKLADLVLGMEGVEKDSWVGRSDWDDYWLDEDQIEYACIDAFVSFLLGKALRVWSWVDEDDDDDDEDDDDDDDDDGDDEDDDYYY